MLLFIVFTIDQMLQSHIYVHAVNTNVICSVFPFVTMGIRNSIQCFHPQNYMCLNFMVCLYKPYDKELVVEKIWVLKMSSRKGS